MAKQLYLFEQNQNTSFDSNTTDDITKKDDFSLREIITYQEENIGYFRNLRSGSKRTDAKDARKVLNGELLEKQDYNDDYKGLVRKVLENTQEKEEQIFKHDYVPRDEDKILINLYDKSREELITQRIANSLEHIRDCVSPSQAREIFDEYKNKRDEIQKQEKFQQDQIKRREFEEFKKTLNHDLYK